MQPSTSFETHAVENQPPPFEPRDLWADKAAAPYYDPRDVPIAEKSGITVGMSRLGSTAEMRMALAHAIHHARHRKTYTCEPLALPNLHGFQSQPLADVGHSRSLGLQ